MVGKWLDSNQIMPHKPLHCRIDTAELAYDKFRLSQNELGSECPQICVCVWTKWVPWGVPSDRRSLASHFDHPPLCYWHSVLSRQALVLSNSSRQLRQSQTKGAALPNTQEKVWRSISEYWSSVASLLLSTSHIDHLLLSTSPTLKPRGALFSITPCVKHSIWKRALISAPHT